MESVSPIRRDLARVRKKLRTMLDDDRFRSNKDDVMRELRADAESLLATVQDLLAVEVR